MTLRIENNYQILDIGRRKLAVESFDNRAFDISDYETGEQVGTVTARDDTDLLDQVAALVSVAQPCDATGADL